MYRPIDFGSFAGGLNLRDSEVNAPQAIDLLNVDFDERGAVKQRFGYAQFNAVELTNQPDSLFSHHESGGTKRLLVGNGNWLDALDTSGASIANVATSASPHYFARFGGPTAELTYIANGTDQVRAFDGATFTSPSGLTSQTGQFLAVTPQSNRLIVAREDGSTEGNNPSAVNFSDAGAPEVFPADNFVDLDPGDGEGITGMVAWSNYVFVFKPSKFWIFYGESTDLTGEAVFNFRKIDVGIGLAASRALVAGRDGVYFMGARGVYRTRGQDPELLSDDISGFFLDSDSPYFKSNTLNHAVGPSAMLWFDERIYLAVPTTTSGANNRVLVYDTRYGWWSLWDLPAAALTLFTASDQPEIYFAASSGTNNVYRHSPAYLNDAMTMDGEGGSAITARWRSGWVDFDDPNVKTLREAALTGEGTVTVGITKDYEDSAGTDQTILLTASQDLWGDGSASDTWGDGTDPTDLWGPAGQRKAKLYRYAIRGRVFSVSFSNNTVDQTFVVHRLVQHMRDVRVPSVVGTERSN